MNFEKQFDQYRCYVDNKIDCVLNRINAHYGLKNAMIYSLKAGGKRIRPVLFIATLESLGIEYEKYAELAVAIEFIHTYSLIHDDLPALDNDDYRRGMPSNHKVFGEGMAVLAGDALLNFAIELALNNIDCKGAFDAVKLLFDYSGVNGMLNGQALDLHYENAIIDDPESVLKKIDEYKTGKLLTAPMVMASLIANKRHIDDFRLLGTLTGQLFQFTDDLLDRVGTFENMGKTLGKDLTSGKLTALSVYGEIRTKEIINEIYMSIIKTLKNIDNNSFFIGFYDYIKSRKS